jgi:molybdopterin-containing oxidoreductase family iron-sulfur binding subunit
MNNSPNGEGGGEYRPLTSAEVFDETWEQHMRKVLAPTGWNSDLAIQAARDALRVIAGEMDAQEFQTRHREAYLREFGVDQRPAEELIPIARAVGAPAEPGASADETPPDSTEEPPLAESGPGREHPGISRRSAIALAGGGMAALLLGDMLSQRIPSALADSGHSPGHGHGGGTPVTGAAPAPGTRAEGVQMGMVIDLERCDGCLMCVAACNREYALPDGVFWIYVMAFKEPNVPGTRLLVRTCQHCSNAPCVAVCPTGARHRRDDDGLVLTDYDICFGCRYCQVACPYGVNYFGWSHPEPGREFRGERRDARGKNVIGAPPKGVMGKCIFDPQRQDSAMLHSSTHCQMACHADVIHFGDLNDPESEPNRYLRQRVEASGGTLSTFRLLDDLGTRPNVIFIGHQPSRRAKPTEGPTRYEDWGFVHEQRIVLEGPEPWFKRVFGR